jgi:adenosylhomocysteine nucleosidase
VPSIGIVAAMHSEAACLGRVPPAGALARLDDSTWIALSGIGPQRAAAAARTLLAQGVGALMSWGTAGGLDPRLASGVLVLPHAVCAIDGRRFPVDAAWRARLAQALPAELMVADGALVSTDDALLSAAVKCQVFADTGAVAVDMESLAIAAVAAAARVPFIGVRAIVDPAGDSLPRAALETVDIFGRPRAAKLARQLLRRPQEITALMRLGAQFARARRSLRAAAACGAALREFAR